MGSLGAFHGCGAEGTSLEGKMRATKLRLLLLPYHSISPLKGSQQMEHSDGIPRAHLPDHRIWHPSGSAGGGQAPSSLTMTKSPWQL